MNRALVCTLILCVCAAFPAAAQSLSLYTFHAPPFQVEAAPGQTPTAVTGSTVDTVQCVIRKMGWTARIATVPQNRAIHALRNHSVDGYFAVRESPMLAPFARPSDPVALEKWYLYSMGPIADVRSARVGVVAGSNEALWLQQTDLSAHMEVSSIAQLLALLERGRVDAILLDRRVLQSHIRQLGPGETRPGKLHSRFVGFAPLHLYLNSEFLDVNMPFLAGFNYHLPGCVNVQFQLDSREAGVIRAKARHLLGRLTREAGLSLHLLNQLPYADLEEVLALDRNWQSHAPDRYSALALRLLSSPTSRTLAQWQEAEKGQVTEIFVMDGMGAITALSRLTSDFWQGDERKFQATVDLGPDEVHLSPVHFDASSRRFQVIASVPVRLQGDGPFQGAVALGLDVELALRNPLEVISPLP